MTIDTELLLRDGSSDLTADESTPTAIDCGGGDLVPRTYFLSVPEVSASDTLDVTIEGSHDNSTFVPVLKFAQVTAAGVFFREGIVNYRYRRAVCDVTGSDTDFGAVKIGIVPAGRYTEH